MTRALFVWMMAAPALAQQAVNAGASILQDFEHRTAAYVKMRKEWTKGVAPLKPASSADVLSKHATEMPARIRAGRAGAHQGEFFTPAIRTEFQRLIRLVMASPEGAKIRETLTVEEPALVTLRVNDTYPSSAPLQTASPALLQNLPKLPPELEYRVVGRSLLLRDVDANLIVDYTLDIVR